MLPKIPYQLSEVIIDTRKFSVRPMLSREEKILLYAKESNEPGEIFRAIRQVVNNCVQDANFDVNTLAIFELQYIFLKLRSISISNQINISIDDIDEKTYDFTINLDEIQIKYPEPTLTTAQISPDMWLNLKYPDASLYTNEKFLGASAEKDVIELLIKSCIQSITQTKNGTENITTPFEGTEEEKNTFIDDLPIKTREEVLKFLNNLPTIYHKIEYENTKGDKKVIEMRTLNDFFTLG
jgi:hypothetical protein